MRLALIADVHSNLHALEAVAAALAREDFDDVLCLGDLVGYNAEPRECIALVRTLATRVIEGNHEDDVKRGASGIGTTNAAAAAQRWTRDALDEPHRAWLAALPSRIVEPEAYVAVHGSFLNDRHVTGYVTSTMLEANLRAIAARGLPSVAFCGHTHVALCGWLDAQGECVEHALGEGTVRWPERARVVLANPGSVGQPRDGDPRASFAIVDLEARTFTLRRVAYDVEGAVRAVLAAGLPEALAQRLQAGR